MAEISSEENDYKAKELAFYEATVNAWITTKFEKDKHLLTLSLAAIGLLITLLTTVGAATVCQALIYGAAIFFFLISVISVLFIFDRNSTHLQKILKGDESNDPILKVLDKSASISFFIGIIFILFLGVNTTIAKLAEERRKERKWVKAKRIKR
ncbi:MAG: hypothetical protein MPW15_12355 [Candidatus Manganitrophus sp.]|nr:hypothetical protein [Candidatus Manganitrophus sp.]